jgi:hypothetical protein
MIDNDLDVQISALQNDIHNNTNEIYRLEESTNGKLRKLQELLAERDRISGLKVRVLDGEVQMGVSYHVGRH